MPDNTQFEPNNFWLTGNKEADKERIRMKGRPGLVLGPDENVVGFSNREWIKLPCTRMGTVTVTPQKEASVSPPAPAPGRAEVIGDPRRGSGGYYHPALHVADLSIPPEEEPVLLPFQTKESAYPAQKLVDRVVFLKIYADCVETDITLVIQLIALFPSHLTAA